MHDDRIFHTIEATDTPGPEKSMLPAVLFLDLCAVPFVALAAGGLKSYGLALFVLLPFVLGLAMPLLLARRGRTDFSDCVGALVLALSILSVLLLVFAVEGAICIIMAAPLAGLIALAGALIGRAFVGGGERAATAALIVLVVALPVLTGVESMAPPRSPLWSVTSSIDVDAAPGIVWDHVVAFGELPPPTELLFRAGVAYPLRAEIEGAGVGAIRRCVFTTGPFVEPITAWEPGRHLAFAVTAQPEPMRELSPWPHLHPPHLDGFFVSERGEFRLEPLPGGRTRLIGTTWYHHDLAPATYWRWWTDRVIHRIHMRVLEQIARRSEAARSTGALGVSAIRNP